MNYMTVKEAALKWGISERQAQQLCVDGRIEGANKFGGAWAIPTDAEKPADPRRSPGTPSAATAEAAAPSEEEEITAPAVRHIPMPLLNTAFALGRCAEAVEAIEDPDTRAIARAEYAFFSGRSEEASALAEPYLTHEDAALRLSACWLYAYSNLALDRIDRARLAIAHVKDVSAHIGEHTPPELRALSVCVSTGALVLLHLPLPAELPPMHRAIHLLPPGLRLFALYVLAHHAYLNRNYGESIGMVETALALEGEVYPIPSIYLHLVATMDYMSLRRPDDARRHVLAAWELARPDDLIEALGEHHGLLGGMLEATIKRDAPEDFRRIIAITYRFSAGWRKIHNPETGHDVADNLTTTEFAAAMLAARSWSNKEIAAHMGISEHTVKTYITTAMQKLHITKRKELEGFMLK